MKISFPDTFLYSISWEDARRDKPVLQIDEDDVVLTLTGGGDNVFNYVLDGAHQVHTVDLNEAQYHLMSLKLYAAEHCSYDDLWKLFGEGKTDVFHPLLADAYLNNHITEETMLFWKARAHYFQQGLYYQGSMGNIVWLVKSLGLGSLVYGNHVDMSAWWYKATMTTFRWFLKCFSLILVNTRAMWNLCGCPHNQIKMITKDDKTNLGDFIYEALEPVFTETDIEKDNHHYYVIFNGAFAKDNCPEYLLETNQEILKTQTGRICNHHGALLDQLNKRMYSKVILMDHMDWMELPYIQELAKSLKAQVVTYGKIIFRSASKDPWFVYVFEDAGFETLRLDVRAKGVLMDRVNTYASYWELSFPEAKKLL